MFRATQIQIDLVFTGYRTRNLARACRSRSAALFASMLRKKWRWFMAILHTRCAAVHARRQSGQQTTNVQYAGSLYQQYFATSNEVRGPYITLSTIKIFGSQSVTSSMNITASTRFVAWQRGSLPHQITHVGTKLSGQNYWAHGGTWPCAR